MSNRFAAGAQGQDRGAGLAPNHSSNDASNRNSGTGGDAWSGLLVDGGLSDDSDSDDSDDDAITAAAAQRQRQAVQQRQQAVPRSPAPPQVSPPRIGIIPDNTPSAPASATSPARPSFETRASWTTRAAAVGSRPPDTASQNPPSLKLLGLKSLKDGGPQYGNGAGPTSPGASSSSNGGHAPPTRGPALEIRQQIEERQRQELAQRRANEEQQQQQAQPSSRQLVEEQRRMQGQREYEQRQMQASAIPSPPLQQQQQRRSPSPQTQHPAASSSNGWSTPTAGTFEIVSSSHGRDEPPQQRPQEMPPSPPRARANVHSPPAMQGPRDAQHDSYINFGASDGFGGMQPSFGLSHERRQSPPRPLHVGTDSPRGYQLQDVPSPRASPSTTPVRTAHPLSEEGTPDARRALTRQLGLESESSHSSGTRTPATTASPMHKSTSGESFTSGYSGKAPVSSQGSAMSHIQEHPASQNGLRPLLMHQTSTLSVREGFNAGRPNSPYGAPMDATRSRSPGPAAAAQMLSPNPDQTPQGEDVALQRGGAPPPMPLALPSPVHPPVMVNSGPEIPLHARQPPTGFSDSQPTRTPSTNRRSMFRRSMAFFKGSVDDQPQGGPRPQPVGENAQRQSLFRRSMMKLAGRGPPVMPLTPGMPMSPGVIDADDPRSPQPRVQGFVDEKPRDRKSTYLGGGGMGDEWDVNGYGARFWKRFSLAQHMQEQGAYRQDAETRRRIEKRRKLSLYGSLIGGILIIAAVIGIIVWRENVKTSSIPAAVDRNKYTVTTSTAADSGAKTTTTAVAALATQTSSSSNTRRRRAFNGNSSDEVVRKVREGVASVHPLSRDEHAAVDVGGLARRHARRQHHTQQQHDEHLVARMAPVVRRHASANEA